MEVRIAAVGDIHVGIGSRGRLRPALERIADDADVLLIAGDLTAHGTAEEGRILADELRGLPIPIAAVLGNHDYHRGEEVAIRAAAESAGIVVLEGERVVFDVRGTRVGVAGVKGFGGGFLGACGSEFGEEEMKAFIRHSRSRATLLCEELSALDAEMRIALTHYSPTAGTLEGERLEIYPFLGSYLLGEAIDAAGCHLALHGHAHKGVENGVTLGGVPVHNVAYAVIRRPYAVYPWIPLRVPAEAGSPAVPPPSSPA
jgi:Icc-related predicted phosphoesterase